MIEMTRQEMVDKSYAFLRAQGCKSMVEGVCVYKTLDGKKCAIGCLIPDDEYRPKFEGISVFGLSGKFGIFDRVEAWFLNDLQQQHDGIREGEDFLDQLKKNYSAFSERYKLKDPTCEEK